MKKKNIDRLMMVVPDSMIDVVQNFLNNQSNLQIINSVHNDEFLSYDDTKFKIILLSERQIIAYFFTRMYHKGIVNFRNVS